jgi:hypothetical protein
MAQIRPDLRKAIEEGFDGVAAYIRTAGAKLDAKDIAGARADLNVASHDLASLKQTVNKHLA